MQLQSFDEIEQGIGGRPRKAETKVRLSVYLSPSEARILKVKSEQQGQSTSQLLRTLVRENMTATDQ